MKTLKEQLQAKLNERFNVFLKESINGVDYKIMPLKADIPTIDEVKYYESEDTFIILFKTKSTLSELIEKPLSSQKNYALLLDNDGLIKGFKIKNIKTNLQENKNTIDKDIATETNLMKEEQPPAVIAQNNLKKRTLSFFRDFIKTEAELVINNPSF